MALAPQTQLGPYRILAPLGAGGMGQVYRARDLRLDRDVALKVLAESVATSPEHRARFDREARMVASLNHPNIITLHSIEEAEGTRFLIMELLEGRDLDAVIKPGGLPLGEILDLAIPIADALVAAHERGVVHRDLKPANVMVTRENRVKVLDFGLAKLAENPLEFEVTQEQGITTSHELIGTVPYMAPEQITGRPLDARTDHFAFGILLFELATGRRPFTGRSTFEVCSAIVNDATPSVTAARPELPGDFQSIVARCLEKRPQDRYTKTSELADELRALRGASAGLPRPASGVIDVGSIAVLPFVNRSASAEDEYFSDGLADELINVLTRIRGLRVSARASSFYFKGKDVPLAEVGRALKVATLLDGSVRKSGSRVRISVQLVTVPEGATLWSETYDRTLDDMFAVQDDIAHAVVKELRTTLLGEVADSDASGEARQDIARAAAGRGRNHAEAHRLFLLARYLEERFNREDTARAIAYLKQALDLDPEFALAWALLGGAYLRQAGYSWMPVAEAQARADEALRRALAIEPDLVEAHSALAWLQMVYGDPQTAEASMRRAGALAPRNPLVLRRAGMLATIVGRVDESIELFERALRQDPLGARTYHTLAWSLHAAGRFAEAVTAYRKALELSPQMAGGHGLLALALLDAGRPEEAHAEVAAETDAVVRLFCGSIVEWTLGNRAAADAALRELEHDHASEAAAQIAEVVAARGETDAAFAWLERARTQHDPGLSNLLTNPRFYRLHGDPRWTALVGALKLRA